MRIFFNLLITLLIFITAFPAVILLYSRKNRQNSWEHQHSTISLYLSTILLFFTALIIYGSFIEPKLLVVNKYEIDLTKINEPIKIVFISDFQVGKYKQTTWMEKIVNRTLSLKPDIVLIGGDQIDNEDYNLNEFSYLEPLKKLTEQIPTYAVPGNHEYGISCSNGIDHECTSAGDLSVESKKTMENLGIKYLINNEEKINIGNSNFHLFGGDEYWTKNLDYSIIKNITDNDPVIALIHNPAFIFSSYPKFDLVLSGHTHGGQIRLPLIGPLGRVDNLLPGKYYQGLHQLDQYTKLLVTSGAGETGVRARLFNPPEIILLTIK